MINNIIMENTITDENVKLINPMHLLTSVKAFKD